MYSNLTSSLAVSMRRLVVNPKGYTFSDGTFLPSGTLLLFPSNAIHLDEKNFTNPTEFDGFRFSKIRAGDKEDSPRHQMVNTNATNLSFGMGKHACPGRFVLTVLFQDVLDSLLIFSLIPLVP